MIHQVVSHKFIVLCLSILVSLPFLIKLPEVKTVDNVDYFGNKNDPDIVFYKELKTIFGNDEFFIIAFKKDNLFTAKNLGLLKRLTDELAGFEGIREIKSLSNVEDTIGEEDFFIVRKFLETIPEGRLELEALRKRAIENPLYRDNFLSPDGNTAAIVIFVHEKPGEPGYRKKIIAQVETILKKYQADTGKVYIAGWTVTNLLLSQYMKQDIITFVPITYGFIALAIFLFFRNILLTMIALVNVSLCMGCTMGMFQILGIPLNNVTTIVPPAVMAMALCDTVHIFSGFHRQLFEQYPDKKEAFEVVLKKLVGPCFLTTFTTFVGFLSLYLNVIPPIKEFALIASAGMVFEFFFAFTFLPAFMLLFNEKKLFDSCFRSNIEKLNMSLFLTRLSGLVVRYFRLIFLAGVIIIFISLWWSSQISVETDLLAYFKKGSPVRTSADFVEKELAGISTLDISFKASEQQAFRKPENLRVIETLQNHISRMDGVDKTLSFVDFLKDMNESFHSENSEFYRIPDSINLISQYLLIYDAADIRNFVNDSFDHARMSIRISKHSTRDQTVMIKQIRAVIKTMDSQGMDIQISGSVLQEVNTIDALVKGQVYSLATSIIIIFLVMFFMLRSFPLWVLTVLPNLFPIALNFGIMGLFNISLNTATALVATVAIGIAVDDTIHFMMELKRNMVGGVDTREAVKNTFQVKGKAMMLSSLILCIGFGVMIFSRFVPTMNFGVLSSMIMITALIGDILLLPASVLMFSSWINIKRY